MKRKVLATVLGVAGLLGLAASSNAQGLIAFDNYDSTPYFPVVYGAGSGALTGTLAGSNVNVELGYFIGTSSNPAQFTLLPTSIVGINPNTPGYFQGGIASIPGYTAGPISFEILAWTGATLANAAYSNVTSPTIWTEPSISASPSPAGFFTALPANTVLTPTPEPTTLALAGLGGLASLVAFRRKNA